MGFVGAMEGVIPESSAGGAHDEQDEEEGERHEGAEATAEQRGEEENIICLRSEAIGVSEFRRPVHAFCLLFVRAKSKSFSSGAPFLYSSNSGKRGRFGRTD